MKNLYLETSSGVLDVIQEVVGVGDFAQVKENADELELFGKRCKVISLDDLIKVKTQLKRPKDQLLLEELLSLKKSKS